MGCLLTVSMAEVPDAGPVSRPNVLFIAIDDLNDWVGVLGGHPMARTPHMDGLARRGVVFANAHCQAPLCNPSRTSLLMGLRPSTTGIHGLVPSIRSLEEWAGRDSLPQHFQRHGYRTLAAGKIWHAIPAGDRAQEFDGYGPGGGVGVRPEKKLIGPTPGGNNPLMDWGSFEHRDEDKGDWQVAEWACRELGKPAGAQPFFMAVGFFLPHVPCYVSPGWMERFPDDDRVLPWVKDGEREGTPRFSWNLHWWLPEPRLSWLKEHGQWRNLCRSYLASTAFVDAQVGRVLLALAASEHRDNTVIVLFSDHGYHLGEKEITGKNTLWERSTRVPLVFAGPGVRGGGRCSQPVELLDLYPTLSALAGLPAPTGVEGISLLPQLRDPAAVRERPAITTHNQGNHAVRSERWRYIRYADGSEELYDLRTDPREWTNLVSQVAHAGELVRHRGWLPARDVPSAPGSAHRVLTYDAGTGQATWEGESFPAHGPIRMR